jgi:nicotinate-nucleotide--dimethylbenzimidazole phosphoribosyltransferase
MIGSSTQTRVTETALARIGEARRRSARTACRALESADIAQVLASSARRHARAYRCCSMGSSPSPKPAWPRMWNLAWSHGAAGHRSTEPAQQLALDKLGLPPILDLGLRLGEGTGPYCAPGCCARPSPATGAGPLLISAPRRGAAHNQIPS